MYFYWLQQFFSSNDYLFELTLDLNSFSWGFDIYHYNLTFGEKKPKSAMSWHMEPVTRNSESQIVFPKSPIHWFEP